MKRPGTPRQHSFVSRLERIALGLDYFAVSVPARITRALGTRGPVPVMARINGSRPFAVSLYPRGGGRHGLRVKAAVRREAGLRGGMRVQVTLTVRDRLAEAAALPADLIAALRAADMAAGFAALPPGLRGFTLRKIEQAAKAATRARRIADAVALARRRS